MCEHTTDPHAPSLLDHRNFREGSLHRRRMNHHTTDLLRHYHHHRHYHHRRHPCRCHNHHRGKRHRRCHNHRRVNRYHCHHDRHYHHHRRRSRRENYHNRVDVHLIAGTGERFLQRINKCPLQIIKQNSKSCLCM